MLKVSSLAHILAGKCTPFFNCTITLPDIHRSCTISPDLWPKHPSRLQALGQHPVVCVQVVYSRCRLVWVWREFYFIYSAIYVTITSFVFWR